MKAVNYARHDEWRREEEPSNNVIYLYDNRRVRSRRRKKNPDVFWNVLFSGLCLSVLVVLFLH